MEMWHNVSIVFDGKHYLLLQDILGFGFNNFNTLLLIGKTRSL